MPAMSCVELHLELMALNLHYLNEYLTWIEWHPYGVWAHYRHVHEMGQPVVMHRPDWPFAMDSRSI